MKKYKRISIDVEAQQYFPYSEIDVDGFRNIIEEVLDPTTSTVIQIVKRAVIERGDQTLDVGPGDWVVQYQDESVSVKKNRDFTGDFAESSPD